MNQYYHHRQDSPIIDWKTARDRCEGLNQKLPTFTTHQAFDEFLLAIDTLNVSTIYVGAQTRNGGQLLYQYIWQWVDGRNAFVAINVDAVYQEMCALYVTSSMSKSGFLKAIDCQKLENYLS